MRVRSKSWVRWGWLAGLAWAGLCGTMVPAVMAQGTATAPAAAKVEKPVPPQPPLPSTVAPNAQLVEVYAEKSFFEGPTWDPVTKKLYFTSFAKDTQILRLDAPGKVTVFLDKTEGVNGTFLAQNGRLLGAQAYGHRLVSLGIGPNGVTDTIVLAENKTWNQPNDVAQSPRGGIYFTDPDFKKRETSAVYYLSSAGEVQKIIQDMPLPNGLKVSNDGKTLYVSDSHLKHWKAYPIQTNGTVGPGHVFFDPDTPRKDEPDGLSIDEKGNLYFSGRGGVWVADKFGNSLGLIPVKEFCSNVTFGGEDGKTLYLTCSGKVYSLAMTVKGAQFLPQPKPAAK